MQKVIAKINLRAIVNNAKYFKTATGAKLCAVVKADAYGHGAVRVAGALSGVADFFAVALVEEGIEISSAVCGKEVLVLTPPITYEEAAAIIENGFVATVGDMRTAALLSRAAKRLGKRVRVHLKVNTGMNRYGANFSMLGKLCKRFFSDGGIEVCGVYSHLYASDEETARSQREIFLRAKRISERYFSGLTYHLSATYGATLGADFAFDAVRIGLGLYGYLPVRVDGVELEKAASVLARCELTRKYSYGGAGYGKNVRLEKGERISVFRLGYADGFLRKRKNGSRGSEKNVNVLCMDACVRKGAKRVGTYEAFLTDAEATAKETGTIAYEVLCAATKRASFLYEWR